MHWIFSSLWHKVFDHLVSILNIYIPALYSEKKDYWQSIQVMLSSLHPENLIMDGDLNITLSVKEKKGGSIVRYPLREMVEDLMSG